MVVPGDSLERAKALFGGRGEVVTVAGGRSRRESVARGLALVKTPAVVVHDGARPLAPATLVRSVLDALQHAEGAIAAVPLDDTLKRVEERTVVGTVNRASLWRAQTPQAFRTEALRAAHGRAEPGYQPATDDAELIERSGGRVIVVDGARTNIKVTYPEDWSLAEALLKTRP